MPPPYPHSSRRPRTSSPRTKPRRRTWSSKTPLFPIDDGVRQRLTMRFGAGVATWFDELPDLLSGLVERWEIELGSPIPRGSVSVVIRCRLRDGRRGVLKVSPDRARLAGEATALERWATPHTPTV